MPTQAQIAAKAAREAAKLQQTSVPEVKSSKISSWDEYDELFDTDVENLTFHISDVKHKDSKNNRFYKVRTDQDKVISWWRTTRDLVIEVDEEGNCSLLPGTTITDDGALIPAGSGTNGNFGDDLEV